ncbi:MAG: ABC transporter substrate-binding protein, partial [Chloroflexota bacterium]
MSRKRVLTGGVWGLLLVLLTMASVGVTAQARTNFIFVRPQEIVSLDPAQVTESQSGFIIRNVYSRLVDISYDGTTVQPDLAEKWEVSEDGLTYTFHLRPNVKFQDGSILAASDVAYSLKRFISLGEGDSATFAPYLDADGTEAVDDTTVKITLKAPFTAFLQVLGIPRGASIVSQKWVEANATADDPWAAEYLASNAMGTGPYKFVEWIPSDHVTMTRFDDYYGGPAPIQEVVSLMNADDTSTRLAIERGDVDAVQRLPDDVIRAINADKNLVIYRRPSYSSVFWVFQTQLKPFDDV